MEDKLPIISLLQQSIEQRIQMDEQAAPTSMLNTSFDSLEGSLLQKAHESVVYRPAFSCSSMKHALKQQARRRKRNTAIASGNSPPITRVSMKAAGAAAISPQSFILNDLSCYDEANRRASRASDAKPYECFPERPAEDAKDSYAGVEKRVSKAELKHTKDLSVTTVKIPSLTQSSVRSSIRLANSCAQSTTATFLPVTQSASTSTASCSISSYGGSTTVTQANKSLRVCPPQSSPKDSQSFSMTLMQTYLAAVPGFKQRKKSQRKLSVSAQLAQTKEGSIDLETPDSILLGLNVKSLLNKYSYGLLPIDYQSKLAQLLPRVDVTDATDNLSQSSNWLNNEFLARACESWRARLGEGEFSHESQLKLKAESEKEKSKIDPWKIIHFEPVWGMKQQTGEASKPELKPEPSVIPSPQVESPYVENNKSKFTNLHIEKLDKILDVISRKIAKKQKTEQAQYTLQVAEPKEIESCPICCNSRGLSVGGGCVCECGVIPQGQFVSEKRKAESVDILAKRFCNNSSVTDLLPPIHPTEIVASSSQQPVVETPDISVSYVSTSPNQSHNPVIQPFTYTQITPQEEIPTTVAAQKSNKFPFSKIDSPIQNSQLVEEPHISSVTVRKAPKIVAKVPTSVNTVTLRVGKPHSGGVNIQRSYEIVQAVIANSPNRNQLTAQLKSPAKLIAESVGRSPSKSVNKSSPITWPPTSPITILRKSSEKPGFMQTVSVSNLQLIRIPNISSNDKMEPPRASSVPPIATSLTSISPRPNSVGPRIFISTANQTILNISHVPQNSFLYEGNPSPGDDSGDIGMVPSDVQQHTLSERQVEDSEDEFASDASEVKGEGVAEAEIYSVDSVDATYPEGEEVFSQKMSELNSPSNNEGFQENCGYVNQDTFPENVTKEHQNTPEAYSDESSFSNFSRTGNYIFAAHPSSDSSGQEEIGQYHAEVDVAYKTEAEIAYHQVNSQDAPQYSSEEQPEEISDDTGVMENQSSGYCDAQYESQVSIEQEGENSYPYEAATFCEQQESPVQYNAAEATQQDQVIRAYSRVAYKVDGRTINNYSGSAVQLPKKHNAQQYVNVSHVQQAYGRQATMPMSLDDSNANQVRNVNNNQIDNSPVVYHKVNNSFSVQNNIPVGGQGIKGGFAAQKSKSDSTINEDSCPCNMQAMIMCMNCGAFCHHDCISSTRLCVTCFIR